MVADIYLTQMRNLVKVRLMSQNQIKLGSNKSIHSPQAMHNFMGPTFLWFVQPKVHPINGNTVAKKHPEVSETQLAIIPQAHAYKLSHS